MSAIGGGGGCTWRREVELIGVVQSVRNTTDVLYVRGATSDKKEVDVRQPDGRVVPGKKLIEQVISYTGCISTIADTALFERDLDGTIKVKFSIVPGDLTPTKPFRFVVRNMSHVFFPELDVSFIGDYDKGKGRCDIREVDPSTNVWEIRLLE